MTPAATGKGQRTVPGTITGQDNEVSMSLGGATRAHNGVKQVTRQKYGGSTQATNTMTKKEVNDSTSKAHIIVA